MREKFMYEKLMKQLTPLYRAMIGIVALLVGMVWLIASEETLDIYAFFIMVAAGFCLVNAFVEKVTACRTDLILWVVLNLAVIIVCFWILESEDIAGVRMYTLLGICAAADWVINTILISCETMFRRIVMGFVAALFHVIYTVAAFMLPILANVFL